MLTPRVRQPSTISKRSYLTRRGHADSLTSWQIFGKSWMSGSATLNWPVFFFMSVRFLRSFAYLLESIIPSLQLWVQNRYGHAFLSFPLIPSILCLGIISKASFGNFKIGNMAFSFSRLPPRATASEKENFTTTPLPNINWIYKRKKRIYRCRCM